MTAPPPADAPIAVGVAPPPGERAYRRRITTEIWIVLGLSLGKSGLYAVVNIIDRLTAGPPLGDQTTTLNPSRSPRPWLDLTYQLLQVGFALVPVALALYLLSANGKSAVRRIGLEFTRPWRDLAVGVGLAAAIGIPGLGLYAVARTLGLAVEVQAAALNAAWWTIPVLLLAALQNALLEEVIVVGYLMERLRELRWSAPAIVVTSALVRGSYHLYQGWGAFVGNVIMGLLFAEYYRRKRRVMPLVMAHTIMDTVVFVGYSLIPAAWIAAIGLN
ncbi:CPBP family intramembrane glutamic endopeptidase [Cellulomonas sp. Leaf334]|uniref:CPBP family intramembrane glutamic endopeptidase n=1 Tax=Cellulomonas sp. Leaf334 TaxID=1736339 RepID=UPI0006F7C074|nr:CPBP family intramembrane glutamic endopeptidase [Cellulomonas sp. Leaf334]KQR17900.1 CAAX protease [Cellulomonas sp. Leaf334]